MLKHVAELTLAPSRDEKLPMGSQEPANQCLSAENQLIKIPSVPLGMESTLLHKIDKNKIFTAFKAKYLKQHKLSKNHPLTGPSKTVSPPILFSMKVLFP